MRFTNCFYRIDKNTYKRYKAINGKPLSGEVFYKISLHWTFKPKMCCSLWFVCLRVKSSIASDRYLIGTQVRHNLNVYLSCECRHRKAWNGLLIYEKLIKYRFIVCGRFRWWWFDLFSLINILSNFSFACLAWRTARGWGNFVISQFIIITQ